MILYIDTISLLPKITLIKNNNIIFSSKILMNNRQELSENIINKIIKLYSKKKYSNNIKKIFVCIGPGSYTGLRVGMSVAIGIKMVNNIPLYGYSAFDAFLEYSIKYYKFNNLYILIQSNKNQNFIVVYNKKNKQIVKPQKIRDINEFFSRKIIKNSILISNEKLHKNNYLYKDRFSKIINVNLIDMLTKIDLKKIKKYRKIISPIYFSNIY